MINRIMPSVVLIASLGISPIASAAECSCQCSKVNLTLERPINLVLEPQYENAKVKEPSPVPKKKKVTECTETHLHKLQYGPNTPESPLLKEKESPPLQVDGVKYEKTKELYVGPAQEHVVKEEVIHEAAPESSPSPSQ